MFALILDSLGSTELLFILVVALIFFGPRKLPQLARSMGKSMAEFRKASEDFKRTWEREVAMETVRTEESNNTILGEKPLLTNNDAHTIEPPFIEPAQPELVVPRESTYQRTTETSPATIEAGHETTVAKPSPKHDWL